MDTTIAQRFEALIKALKMNHNSFANSIGKTPTLMKQITDGKSRPGWEVIESIAIKYPQVNSNWLLRGEGEMFLKEQEAIADAKVWERVVDRYEKTIEDLRYTISLQRQLLGKYNPAPIRPSAGSNIIKLFPMYEENEIMAIKA